MSARYSPSTDSRASPSARSSPFVGLNKSFTQPISQLSMQINFVVTAAAGAQRVFDLMDRSPRRTTATSSS